ncbi:hypothetical protein [Paracoccus sp. (in: a-proteobacteria)]|uniref:hypothetical protein n=1 Tax=Paracoccus sp. TaxID=267 RepID=UPI003A8706E1
MFLKTAFAAAIAIILPGLAAQANTRITANCFFPAQHFICAKILKGWAGQVSDVTGGRVRVNVPAKSMAPPPEQLASVQGGVFDAAFQFNGFIADRHIGVAVSLQPYVNGNDPLANATAFWHTWQQYIADKDPLPGVRVLGVMASPGADFYSTTDQPITSLADAAARKMWALPGVTAGIMKDIGSATVSGPAVQMTEIIQRRVVDGFVGIPASDALAFKVLPYAKSVTRTHAKIFAPTFTFFISEAKWAEIDPADQDAILTVSGEAFVAMAAQVWAGAEAGADKELAETAQIVTASDAFEAELAEAAKPYQDRWIEAASAKGIDAQAALDFYRRTVAELSGN